MSKVGAKECVDIHKSKTLVSYEQTKFARFFFCLIRFVVLMLWHSSSNHMHEKCNKMHYNGNVPCVFMLSFPFGIRLGRVYETYKERQILTNTRIQANVKCRAKMKTREKRIWMWEMKANRCLQDNSSSAWNFDKSLLKK